jgi:hypothetical protein
LRSTPPTQHARAKRLLSELLASTENANKALHDEWLDVAITYKVEWEKELRRRERLGIPARQLPVSNADIAAIGFPGTTDRFARVATDATSSTGKERT